MYKIHKVYDIEQFEKITKGVKLAQCMRNDDYCKPIIGTDTIELKAEDLTISDTLYCSFCNTKFENNIEQRQHYKLDWHRYNLKQKLAGLLPVSEDNFTQKADDLSSISGSESETDDESEPASISGTPSNTETESDLKGRSSSSNLIASRHSKVFFENEANEIFSLYKCLLHSKKDVPEFDDTLVDLLKEFPKSHLWIILMLGGGHFASGVFQNGECILHKTFHSYTVRAKQGGSQGTRDGKSGGSNHPKSAGASLRRYNEVALAQHIHEILESWTTQIQSSSLIFYRAVGPHNRYVLFGGKNPPLNKLDLRLRTIPFVTRRATFNEVKRVHDILSSLEVYGSAEQFKTDFPSSPNKREKKVDLRGKNSESDTSLLNSPILGNVGRKSRTSPRGGAIDRAKSREFVQRPLPGHEVGFISSESESDTENLKAKNKKQKHQLESCNLEISFTESLQEFDDTVPNAVRKSKQVNKKPKKKKIKEIIDQNVIFFKKKIWTACSLNDAELLENTLKIEHERIEEERLKETGNSLTDKSQLSESEFKRVLNEPVDDKGNTILHRAAIEGRDNIINILMKFGSDPCNKNKRNQTPYVAAISKEVRKTFRKFLTDFPDKYNYSKSQIPGPYDEEQEKQQTEKKRLLKKAKREKEKVKKKEKIAEKVESEEMKRFASLSDREKRALAAERRILSSKTGIVTRRCFLCGSDIAGKVPFEYSDNCFCSMQCLKAHRIQHGVTLS